MCDYDFSCWVVKYDGSRVHGRIYQKDSLKNNDNIFVPLCWNHNHFDSNNVLGTALLEHRDGDGVYAYCRLNDGPYLENIIKLLKDRGMLALSPFVNQIKYNGNIIMCGSIREVSLVPERVDKNELYYPVLKEDCNGYRT